MNKILIVIPYFANQAQGRELEYAVAGWRKYFKENFCIVLVGDYHKVVESGDDITFIHCPRVGVQTLDNYRKHIDHVNKFLRVRKMFPDSTGFVYTCDDIYPVNDFTMEDILQPKIVSMHIKGDANHKNGWVRDNVKTREKLLQEGLPDKNWVCHLPVYYEWDKLLAIYYKYNCRNCSYVVENLYFNIYFGDADPININDVQTITYKLWDKSGDIDSFKAATKTVKWLCNSVRGWRPEMETVLKDYYGI